MAGNNSNHTYHQPPWLFHTHGNITDRMHTLGMEPPILNNGSQVTGENKGFFRRENKRRRKLKQIGQLTEPNWGWTTYNGLFSLPALEQRPANYRNNMCPANLALNHPAADLLLKYATQGCPTETGKPWTRQDPNECSERNTEA
jgi:hypothetical protein